MRIFFVRGHNMRRLTRREQLREKIAELDSFPKVLPEYAPDVLTSSSWGGLSM
jgi:hypothetical protein